MQTTLLVLLGLFGILAAIAWARFYRVRDPLVLVEALLASMVMAGLAFGAAIAAAVA